MWKSEQCSHVTTKGSTINASECENHLPSIPVNALFKPNEGGIGNGKHFFEFRFEHCKNNALVGVTDEDHFKAGYALKAFLYGGYLSDGSSLLVADFGDQIADNDKVGVLLELETTSLKVYYFHNEKPLGLAFYIKDANMKPLYPVVQFCGSSEVTISKLRIFPSEIERPFIRYFGMEGKWKMDRCENNGTLIPSFNNNWRKFSLKITPDLAAKGKTTENFILMFKIGNTIFATLQCNKGKWSFHPGPSSKILYSGEIADAESYLYNFFHNFDDVELIGQSLVFTAHHRQKITFKRSDSNTAQSVTTNTLK